jgi:hypothetical protein
MGGPFSLPLPGIQPDEVSNVKVGGRQSMVVCILLISKLGSSYLAAQMVVDS